MSSKSLDFIQDTLGHVLSDRWLSVPPYQRPYAWTTENVMDFWNDLESALEDEREYFVGTVVLTREGDSFNVIDGQQRLLTTTLLIAVLRDALYVLNDDELGKHVDDKYLQSYHRPTKIVRPKLLVSESDSEFYRRRFLERAGGVPDSESPSQRRMTQAFDLLRERVAALGATDDPVARIRALNRWIDHLDEHVVVIVVEASTEADAFLIFESLNDRGAPLTIADLLKNYLMSLDPSQARGIQELWNYSLSSLGVETETQEYVTFLRMYWNSSRGPVRERDLYKSLRTEVRSPAMALGFAQELAAASDPYAAILEASHPFWAESSQLTRDAIATLVTLQLVQFRPLLLSAIQVFDPASLEGLAISLVHWTFRGLIVGGIGGGVAERAYSLAGVGIRNGDLGSPAKIFDQLRPIIPTDEQFRSSFEVASAPKRAIADYLVRCLDRARGGSAPYPALESFETQKPCIAGFIVERNADPEKWPGFAPEDLYRQANRIGNLFSKLNGPEPKYTDWTERRTWVVGAGERNDPSLLAFERWSPESIRHRQSDMAAVAVEVWPRRPI